MTHPDNERPGPTPALFLLLGLIPLAGFAAFACSTGQGAQCRVGADCASGACDATGRCVAALTPGVDAGAPEDAHADVVAPFDAPTEAMIMGCAPNHDGVVDRAEVPLVAGLHATFRYAANVTVSTAGTTQPDGSRVWDLAAALSGDHDVKVQTEPTTGAWYAADFASATYATKLADTSDLRGVFHASDGGLDLQGVVSPDAGASKTELTYAPAVTTLALPMQMGSTWQTSANVTGVASGIGSIYTEAYQSKVDAHGELKTPYGSFSVLRVHTVLTRTVGLLVTVTRTDAFVAECAGVVASITSQTNEAMDEFTSAAEVQRLAP